MSDAQTFEPRIWGLSGKMGAGKDTVKDVLEGRVGGSWRKVAIGDIIKLYGSHITVQCDVGHLRMAVGWQDPVTGVVTVPNVGDVRPMVDGVPAKIVPCRPDVCWCGSTVACAVDLFEAGHTSDGRGVLQWLAVAEATGDPDRWIAPVIGEAERLLADGHHVAWIGIRTVLEADAACQHPDATVIRLDVSSETQVERLLARDGKLPSDDTFSHPTEVELDGYVGWSCVVDANQSLNQIVDDIVGRSQDAA